MERTHSAPSGFGLEPTFPNPLSKWVRVGSRQWVRETGGFAVGSRQGGFLAMWVRSGFAPKWVRESGFEWVRKCGFAESGFAWETPKWVRSGFAKVGSRVGSRKGRFAGERLGGDWVRKSGFASGFAWNPLAFRSGFEQPSAGGGNAPVRRLWRPRRRSKRRMGKEGKTAGG